MPRAILEKLNIKKDELKYIEYILNGFFHQNFDITSNFSVYAIEKLIQILKIEDKDSQSAIQEIIVQITTASRIKNFDMATKFFDISKIILSEKNINALLHYENLIKIQANNNIYNEFIKEFMNYDCPSAFLIIQALIASENKIASQIRILSYRILFDILMRSTEHPIRLQGIAIGLKGLDLIPETTDQPFYKNYCENLQQRIHIYSEELDNDRDEEKIKNLFNLINYKNNSTHHHKKYLEIILEYIYLKNPAIISTDPYHFFLKIITRDSGTKALQYTKNLREIISLITAKFVHPNEQHQMVVQLLNAFADNPYDEQIIFLLAHLFSSESSFQGRDSELSHAFYLLLERYGDQFKMAAKFKNQSYAYNIEIETKARLLDIALTNNNPFVQESKHLIKEKNFFPDEAFSLLDSGMIKLDFLLDLINQEQDDSARIILAIILLNHFIRLSHNDFEKSSAEKLLFFILISFENYFSNIFFKTKSQLFDHNMMLQKLLAENEIKNLISNFIPTSDLEGVVFYSIPQSILNQIKPLYHIRGDEAKLTRSITSGLMQIKNHIAADPNYFRIQSTLIDKKKIKHPFLSLLENEIKEIKNNPNRSKNYSKYKLKELTALISRWNDQIKLVLKQLLSDELKTDENLTLFEKMFEIFKSDIEKLSIQPNKIGLSERTSIDNHSEEKIKLQESLNLLYETLQENRDLNGSQDDLEDEEQIMESMQWVVTTFSMDNRMLTHSQVNERKQSGEQKTIYRGIQSLENLQSSKSEEQIIEPKNEKQNKKANEGIIRKELNIENQFEICHKLLNHQYQTIYLFLHDLLDATSREQNFKILKSIQFKNLSTIELNKIKTVLSSKENNLILKIIKLFNSPENIFEENVRQYLLGKSLVFNPLINKVYLPDIHKLRQLMHQKLLRQSKNALLLLGSSLKYLVPALLSLGGGYYFYYLLVEELDRIIVPSYLLSASNSTHSNNIYLPQMNPFLEANATETFSNFGFGGEGLATIIVPYRDLNNSYLVFKIMIETINLLIESLSQIKFFLNNAIIWAAIVTACIAFMILKAVFEKPLTMLNTLIHQKLSQEILFKPENIWYDLETNQIKVLFQQREYIVEGQPKNVPNEILALAELLIPKKNIYTGIIKSNSLYVNKEIAKQDDREIELKEIVTNP